MKISKSIEFNWELEWSLALISYIFFNVRTFNKNFLSGVIFELDNLFMFVNETQQMESSITQ